MNEDELNTSCPPMALCCSWSGKKSEPGGFGWVFERPSVFCIKEALANASMFCDEEIENERVANVWISLRWRPEDGIETQRTRARDFELGRFLETAGSNSRYPSPSLILIEAACLNPLQREGGEERLRNQRRNNLMIGLAAIDAVGEEFSEIEYQIAPSVSSSEAAIQAANRELERLALEAETKEPGVSSRAPRI